jgi:hypothetical protein
MRRRAGHWAWSREEHDSVNVSALMAGSARRVTSTAFKGGTVNATLGEVQLDLTNATVEARPAVLNVRAFMGGVKLVVPRAWHVEFDVAVTLGEVRDERSRGGDAASEQPHLVITGQVFMGTINVRD